ncbi:tetratricopeptide repeat-containing sensor histidine kinase [Psychroserpens sp. MEBiC05023]
MRVNRFKLIGFWLFQLMLLCSVHTGFSQHIQFKDSITNKIKNQKSDSLKASVFYDAAAYSAQKLADLKMFRVYTDSSMYYAKISGHKDLEAKSHFAYGMLERFEGNYDKALTHLQKNIEYFEGDSLMKPYALFQVGVIYKNQGKYKKGLSTYLEILSIFENRKDSFAIASTLNSIAVIYGEMDNYDEAIINLIKARHIFVEKNIEKDIANTDSNISDMYLKKSDYENAIKYANSSLMLAQKIGHKNLMGKAFQSLGKIHAKFDKNKALDYLLKAEKTFLESGFYKEILSVYRNIGNLYYELNNFDKAKYYLKKGYDLSKENQIQIELRNISRSLSELYSKELNYKEAYRFRLEYERAKDTLFNIDNEKNIKELQTKYETAEKDKQLVQKQLSIEKQEQQLQKKQSQTKLMTGLIVFLLLTSILTWFLFKQHQKRKDHEIVSLKREQQVKTLELLMEGEEKERLRIAKELHDGVNVDLSSIKYKLTSLLEKNNEVINEAVAMIDKSCEQVRAISHNLVPPSLKDFSLLDAIDDYCSTMNNLHKPDIVFHSIGNPIIIDNKAEINIFRIVQELVNNSIKHAEATEIDVQVSFQNKTMQLTIEDNGKGFDSEITSNGIGLQNIQSRIDYLQAKLDFKSDSNGTSYLIDINTEIIS